MEQTIRELEQVIAELKERKVYSAVTLLEPVLETAKEEHEKLSEFYRKMLQLP